MDNVLVLSQKYKARTGKIYPSNLNSKELEKYKHCILGFSVENDKFIGEKLKSIIDFINSRFNKCTIIIGDSIHRLNLRIQDPSLSEEHAFYKAQKAAQSCIDTTSHLFFNNKNTCKFEFLGTSAYQGTQEYTQFYSALVELRRLDSKFNKSIHHFAQFYLTRCGGRAQNELTLDLASQYLIEELAVFACMVKQLDTNMFLYPGVLSTMAEISEGLYPNAPKELKETVTVELGFRKRKNAPVNLYTHPTVSRNIRATLMPAI